MITMFHIDLFSFFLGWIVCMIVICLIILVSTKIEEIKKKSRLVDWEDINADIWTPDEK